MPSCWAKPMVLSAPSEIQPASGSSLGRVSGLWEAGSFRSVSLGAEAKAVCFPLHSTALGFFKGNHE